MEERIVKGIWIPIEIWEAEDLSWSEKILLMEIDSFTKQGCDCYFSNEYIGKLLKINEKYAGEILNGLIKKGYVKKTQFDGRRRFVESALVYSNDLPFNRLEADSRKIEMQTPEKSGGRLQKNLDILNTITNTDYYKKENIVKESSSKRFVKPSIEEIEARIREMNYRVDAEVFYNYYESNGWKVGSNPMKDWRAALVTWEKKETNKKESYGTRTINTASARPRERVNHDWSHDRTDIQI